MVSRPVKFRCAVIVILIFAAGACVTDGVTYTSGERQEIRCNNFPLKIALSARSGYPVKCTSRNTAEPGLMATRYHMFFRFVQDDRSYANIHYSEAGDGTLVNIRSVMEKTLQSRKVRTDADNWGGPSHLWIGDRKYGYVTFDLPQRRSCIAYNGYEGQRGPGYEKNFYGYLCSKTTQIKVSHLRDFLTHMVPRD